MTIAAILPLDRTFDRDVMRGVGEWALAHGGVEIHNWSHWHSTGSTAQPGLPTNARGRLAHFGVRAILTDIWTRDALNSLRRLPIPVVDVGGTWSVAEIGGIHVDFFAAAEMAAQHFMELGLRSVAYTGKEACLYSRQLQQSFTAKLAAARLSCPVFNCSIDFLEDDVAEDFRRWANSFPKPLGVFCYTDERALSVVKACEACGIRVPDELAVLTLGDNELNVTLGPVSISGIGLNGKNVGYQAMELLARMIRTGYRPQKHLLLPPGRLEQRFSSDVLAVDDALLCDAIRFIRHNANKPISVADVLRAVPISRRHLEAQMRAVLRRTPAAQIRYEQIARAKSLLATDNLSLAQTAMSCGFRNQPTFCRVFKRWTHVSPGTYRAGLRRPGDIATARPSRAASSR